MGQENRSAGRRALPCRRHYVLLFGGDEHEHAFALEFWHLLGLAVFEEGLGEFQQLLLTLLLVDDAAATEEDIDFNLVALFEETDGVVEFELEVVVVGLRAKAYLLDNHLARLGFHLFLLLFELVVELLIVDDFAYRWLGVGGNLDEVEALVVSHAESIANIHNGGFHAIANDADCRCGDAVVDAVVGFLLDGSAGALTLVRLWFEWGCQ